VRESQLHQAVRDPGQQGKVTWPHGRTPSLGRLIMDMIEEYARHVGHADLIREPVGGLAGKEPE